MTDLDRLIDAVEAGDAPWREIATIAFVCGPQIAAWRRTVGEAYNGSLDDAKALHDALLPGWRWSVGSIDPDESTGLFHGYVWPNDKPKRERVFRPAGTREYPSREWLLAILLAYRATQEPKT